MFSPVYTGNGPTSILKASLALVGVLTLSLHAAAQSGPANQAPTGSVKNELRCRTCPPPDPTPSYGWESFAPKYYILSTLYAAPGMSSTTGFTNGTSQGTFTSISNSFAAGTTLTFTATGGFPLGGSLGTSFGITATSENAQEFEDTLSSTKGSVLTSTSDNVDHSQDHFFLWLNPLVTVKQNGPAGGTYSLGTPGTEPADIIDVSVAELRNPALLQQSWKWGPQHIHGYTVPGLSVLTDADCANILATDPLASVDPSTPPSTVDSTRFIYIDSQPLEGPDYSGAGTVTYSFTESDARTQTATVTRKTDYSVGFDAGIGTKIGDFSLNLASSNSFTWTDSIANGRTSGVTHEAAVTFGTQTVGCFEWVDIYEDTQFHTFAFVQPNPSSCGAGPGAAGKGSLATAAGLSLAKPAVVQPVLTGTVSSFTGEPLGHTLVKITLSDGTVRSVYTSRKGKYEVYSAPDGPVTIDVGQTQTLQSVLAGQTATTNIVVLP